MTDWLMKEMKKISMIEKYAIPSESNYFKLDANENLVLDKDFLTRISLESLKKLISENIPLIFMNGYTKSYLVI